MTRILVIEDERPVAFAIKSLLSTEGYAVDLECNGQTGFEIARHGKYDLILLDIMLPDKDGYSICRDLRQLRNYTPILMVTAKVEEVDKVVGLESGADDYLVKPFGFLELRARVRALLRRTGSSSPELFRFANIEVDFVRAEVRKDQMPIEITPTEYRLLSVFIQRRGHLLTRDQLIEEAWDPGDIPTHRAVDQHIMNLRNKIEVDPHNPRYLVCVRRLGYRFDPHADQNLTQI